MEETKRPVAGTVLGILNIVFCSFGIVSVLFSFVGFGILNAIVGSVPAEPYDEVATFLMAARSFFTISLVISILQAGLNGTGLAGGIYLLNGGKRSILLSNIYAIGTIALVIISFILNKVVVNRMFDNLLVYSDLSSDEIMAMNILKRVIPGFTGVFSIVFGSAYPVVLLALLNRKHILAFYRGTDG